MKRHDRYREQFTHQHRSPSRFRLRNGFMGIFILVASLFAFAAEADTVEVTKVGHWGSGPYNEASVASVGCVLRTF
jgi:hypothetical protein